MGQTALVPRSMVAFTAALLATIAASVESRGADEGAAPTEAQRKAVAALDAAGASIRINGNYEVVSVSLGATRDPNVQATDETLAHLKALPKIESITLSGSGITNAGLEHLKGLSSLRSVSIGSTQITDEGLDALRQALPECRISTRARGFGGTFGSSPFGGSSRDPRGFTPGGFGRGGRSPAGSFATRSTLLGQLLRREVQAELNLTDDQSEQIVGPIRSLYNNADYRALYNRYRAAANDQQREALQGEITKWRDRLQQEAEAKAKELLTPEQFARAQQLILQAVGPSALERDDIAEAVGLSAEQRKTITSLQEAESEARQKLAAERQGGNVDFGTYFQRSRELSQQTQQKILETLSDEQRGKWTELLGPPGPEPERRSPSNEFPRGTTTAPAETIFRFLDRDRDGQLTEEEAARFRSLRTLAEPNGESFDYPLSLDKFTEVYDRLRESTPTRRRPPQE